MSIALVSAAALAAVGIGLNAIPQSFKDRNRAKLRARQDAHIVICDPLAFVIECCGPRKAIDRDELLRQRDELTEKLLQLLQQREAVERWLDQYPSRTRCILYVTLLGIAEVLPSIYAVHESLGFGTIPSVAMGTGIAAATLGLTRVLRRSIARDDYAWYLLPIGATYLAVTFGALILRYLARQEAGEPLAYTIGACIALGASMAVAPFFLDQYLEYLEITRPAGREHQRLKSEARSLKQQISTITQVLGDDEHDLQRREFCATVYLAEHARHAARQRTDPHGGFGPGGTPAPATPVPPRPPVNDTNTTNQPQQTDDDEMVIPDEWLTSLNGHGKDRS